MFQHRDGLPKPSDHTMSLQHQRVGGDRLPLELTMVILCNMLGAMGYVRAMQLFDNLIISVAALLEPVVADLTTAALGVGVFPGTMGWIGNAFVAMGTFAVVYPSASSGKRRRCPLNDWKVR